MKEFFIFSSMAFYGQLSILTTFLEILNWDVNNLVINLYIFCLEVVCLVHDYAEIFRVQ